MRHDGTQSIGRAVGLLKLIATRPAAGWRVADLASQAGLDEATARRVLKRLLLERAVALSPADRRYRPGPLLFELGLTVAPLQAFREACEPELKQLSNATGAASLLYLRAEDEFVCIGRSGAESLHWLVLRVGTRRSLGLSAGGAAILVALPDGERDDVVARCRAEAERRGASYRAQFERILERSVRYGAGVNLGDGLPGVTALAVAIRTAGDRPFAAIGVSGPIERYPENVVESLLARLGAAAARIETGHAEVIAAL
ncbi:MAG: IclR family transcriptional regulator [Lautropia sp.]